ncbi:hypothetical protein Ae201684P_000820 [Aphanomyces euteiches]|uniref:Thioredoxin domain-containing protein n=1 Tax=Aphanomyces euteiches TaxID=100861 RepID=A0A6G0XRT1_9STRA|nr:hypothetical protein Ae201684_002092 [Aphanomyces euteiches]KAH9087410.1 hypothetical protein Ae201684P_000820 [Aphanomyces euteiches]KAH9132606.1 hypothetical protein AeRB84_021043 [Aphanomyces euteiches]KAH9145237.1 hypothetical protein AeRB84_010870 [Aphanomyces euteiches]KAH9147684.1 hypothetical protein AeRB84_008748 [Aphanomyces euteiches]
MSNAFVDLLGPTLLKKEPMPADTAHLIPPKLSYKWRGVTCDKCNNTVVGRRFTCKDDNFDLCHECLPFGFELHPDHILESVPIPDQPPRAPVGEVSTESALSGKYVLLYFSGDWCGFCAPFTEKLEEYYETLRSKGVDFEIVLMSADQDQGSFDDHYGHMPWLALAYSERDKYDAAYKSLSVNGVPTAVLLDPQGQVVTTEGRFRIQADPEGLFFPYAKRSLPEIIGNEFIRRDGSTCDASVFQGKYLGLYFGASWEQFIGRPDSRPIIEKAVKVVRANGHELEVLYCSEEFDPDSITSYFEGTPWIMHPAKKAMYATLELREYLKRDDNSQYCSGYNPTFVLLDPNLQIVNVSAYATMVNQVVAFPWQPLPVVDIRDGNYARGYFLGKKPSVIVYCHGLENDAVEKIDLSLKTLSDEFQDVLFFTNKRAGNKDYTDVGYLIQVHADATEIDTNSPFALLVNKPKDECYVHQDDVGQERLRGLLTKFLAGTLEMKPLDTQKQP